MSVLLIIAGLQVVVAAGVVFRLVRTANGRRIGGNDESAVAPGAITVIVPVLDEFDRLGACLERLTRAGSEVREILVVDGGSTDGTPKIIASFAAADPRVRAVFAAPVPTTWNGKAWGLACGLAAADVRSRWIATIDADVRVRPALLATLARWAVAQRLAAFSVATSQELGDLRSGIIHPSMLATLVYRYGMPGHATTSPARVQANGQCFFAERALLVETDVFARARASVCEDVTVARLLAAGGTPVGFYEAGELAVVRMHDTWRGVWENWPRSLTLRDGLAPLHTIYGLAEVVLVQALPLATLVVLVLAGVTTDARALVFEIEGVLLMVRIGILAGTRRAYRNPAWTYWLSIVADVPTAIALVTSAVRRRHTWRGRTLVIPERNT